jgi:hypothetical protein
LISAVFWVSLRAVTLFFYINMLAGVLPLSPLSTSLAFVPSNGVVQISHSLETILDENDSASAYNQCVTQGRGTRYFSNTCSKLVDVLRKKMSIMALESDVQMQAEKLSKKPLPKDASKRLAILAKINLLSAQAEETIKTAQTGPKNDDAKETLPDIIMAIKKVQISVTAYTKLFPNRLH